jgi:hypothetical protein
VVNGVLYMYFLVLATCVSVVSSRVLGCHGSTRPYLLYTRTPPSMDVSGMWSTRELRLQCGMDEVAGLVSCSLLWKPRYPIVRCRSIRVPRSLIKFQRRPELVRKRRHARFTRLGRTFVPLDVGSGPGVCESDNTLYIGAVFWRCNTQYS